MRRAAGRATSATTASPGQDAPANRARLSIPRPSGHRPALPDVLPHQVLRAASVRANCGLAARRGRQQCRDARHHHLARPGITLPLRQIGGHGEMPGRTEARVQRAGKLYVPPMLPTRHSMHTQCHKWRGGSPATSCSRAAPFARSSLVAVFATLCMLLVVPPEFEYTWTCHGGAPRISVVFYLNSHRTRAHGECKPSVRERARGRTRQRGRSPRSRAPCAAAPLSHLRGKGLGG